MSSPTTTVGLDRVPGARRAPTSIHALAMAARERDRRLFFSTLLFAVAMLLLVPFAVLAAEQPLTVRLAEIEGRLTAFPRSTATELAQIAADDTPREPALDRQIKTMYGLALVLSNRTTEALDLAERMQAAGASGNDPALRAGALLIRSDYEHWAGNSAKAHELAANAREVAAQSTDEYVRFATAYAAGVTARMMGRVDASLASLEEARALAELAQSPYRQSSAYYQLSVLDMMLKQPDRALENALVAYRQARAAGSAFGMVRAKMAESAALEALHRPRQELAALQEALAIARNAGSRVAEALAVVNLADIYLRRKDYRKAHELAKEALDLGRGLDDTALMSVSKLNMGLALLGMGRIDAGRRLADEAVAEYERTGATAEIAETLREYGAYLEQVSDFKGALSLFHREQKLNAEVALAAREKAVLELQSKYESDKRKREIELLNRERDLQSAELRNRELEQRVWWSLAAVFGVSFFVIAVLYHKLRVTNRLLALKNVALHQQSSRDPLTALYNRRHFQEFIRDLPAPNERRRGAGESPVQALLLIDIDHFKQINDRLGHAAGDAVLMAVAQRLRDTLRETDMIVRWGGEEFLVFVPVAPLERMDEIVLRVMNAIGGEPIGYLGHVIRVTASIGYLPMPLPPDDVRLNWDGAIRLVDKALYMAKMQGRNRAYGIAALHARGSDPEHGVDGDLESAWREGTVELRLLLGMPAVDEPGPAARDAAKVH
jgi:diguanylate cyclase (GGDEF)-like protein